VADRAVRWLEEVIASHGTTEGPDRVRIPLSQAALARATARSAGTVTYYVRCLGPLIERRHGALIVDIGALAERRAQRRQRRAELSSRHSRMFAQATADGSTIELVDEARSAPHGRRLTLASAALRGNEASTPVASDVIAGLSAAIASLAETTGRLADLAQQLLALAKSEADPANISAPNFAREALEVREFARELKTQTSSDQEKERKLSVLSERSSRDFAREESQNFAGSLGRDQLDTLLAPLSEACKRYGNKPGFLDENGRRYLSRLSEDQLRAGVDQVIRKLKANTAIDRPFGLLVARAKAGDAEFFTPPPPPPPASTDVAAAEPEQNDGDPDPAVDEAIAALSPAELEVLDAEVAASLSPATLERLRGRPAQLARLRRLAWQRRADNQPEVP
jgi:hypothetical protein